MSTIARRVTEELQAYGDISVTDGDVEQALTAVHDRVDAWAGRRRRSLVLVSAAAVLIAIAVAVGAWLALRSETTGPVDDPVAPGQIVIEYWSHPLWGHGGMVWVYGDGRVITEEDGHPYLERRLAPNGLNLLLDRVDVLDGGLTADELRHPCDPQPCHAVESVIEVNGLNHDVSDNVAMGKLLFEMESRFPDGAWRQRKPTPYVPSAYEVCYGTAGTAETIEQSSMLDGLPVQVRDLLAAKPTSQAPPGLGDLCARLTPAEASRVAEALDVRLGFNNEVYEFVTVHGRQSAFISVSVVLPHGASGAHGG